MQSYSSPGRVVTVENSGPGAVEVRRDQPYRLRNLVGVTQHSARVDQLLNLCVEGAFEQVVALAAGVASAEAGDPVLMNVATFALVTGLADRTGHVQFGVLGERLTASRLTVVKLTPGATLAGGGTDPALAGRMTAVETDVAALKAAPAPSGPEVTVIDISSPGTNQVTFGGLHTIDATAVQATQSGAIKFNRHVYSSGAQLAALGADAWLTLAKDGFYQVELSLYMLDQTTSRNGIGFIFEELQLNADASTAGASLRSVAASRTGGTMSTAVADYIAECSAQGQGRHDDCNRGDAVFFGGPNAPYADRFVTFSWRAFIKAGSKIRVFGTMRTAGFYVTTQIAYGGLSTSNPANGTPDLRFGNPPVPTLRLTRIA